MELAPRDLSSVNWPTCVARPDRRGLAQILDVGVEAELLCGARLWGRIGAGRWHRGARGGQQEDADSCE